MMARVRNVRDDIVVDLAGELREQVRGRGCRPLTGEGSVETGKGQIRRPDFGVDCGQRDPNGATAALPELLIEVLSPSSRDFELFEKAGRVRGGRERRLFHSGRAPCGFCLRLVKRRDRAMGRAPGSRPGREDWHAEAQDGPAFAGRQGRGRRCGSALP